MQTQVMNFVMVLIVAQPIIVGITLWIAHRMVKSGQKMRQKSEKLLREQDALAEIMNRWAV